MKSPMIEFGLFPSFVTTPANQSAAASVPLQIDRAVSGLAMDFGPTVAGAQDAGVQLESNRNAEAADRS